MRAVLSNYEGQPLTLVLGGTGKTGRRIAERLGRMGRPVRIGSRAQTPSFDWNNESGWDACLAGVAAVYISYSPDLAMPGAMDSIQALVGKAKRSGVNRLVLLSGRGETEAQVRANRSGLRFGMDYCARELVQPELFRRRFCRHG